MPSWGSLIVPAERIRDAEGELICDARMANEWAAAGGGQLTGVNEWGLTRALECLKRMLPLGPSMYSCPPGA